MIGKTIKEKENFVKEKCYIILNYNGGEIFDTKDEENNNRVFVFLFYENFFLRRGSFMVLLLNRCLCLPMKLILPRKNDPN